MEAPSSAAASATLVCRISRIQIGASLRRVWDSECEPTSFTTVQHRAPVPLSFLSLSMVADCVWLKLMDTSRIDSNHPLTFDS